MLCNFFRFYKNPLRKQMSTRYFINPSLDHNKGQNVEIPKQFLTEFVLKLIDDIRASFKPNRKNCEDGLYLGTAGISYMFYHLIKNPTFEPHRNLFIENSLVYTDETIKFVEKTPVKKEELPAFILGNSGIYAVAAAVYRLAGKQTESEQFKQKYFEIAKICKKSNFLPYGSDELFVGRAGYISGMLWLCKETNTELPLQELYTLCNIMIESGRQYSRNYNSPCPLMYSYYNVEYLGAAHGLSSILQTILSVPGYLESNRHNYNDIKLSIDYLLSLQDSQNNFPCALDEIGQRNDLIHWCHGAGGVIYLMAKAYLIFKEQKYLESCKKMTDLIWQKGLLKKGPGICHGVAGNGYAFLLLYRLTNDQKYWYRSIEFAKFLKSPEFKRARTPDHPYSLYEGTAGTVCYLADLTHPDGAYFPFSDVFN